MLKDKNIIIGVTGGVAIHKALELVSMLVKQDAIVYVVMTHNATKLISPLQFETLSQNPVITTLFDYHSPTSGPKHIALADKAELFAVVPATANSIGKIALGIADDALSTVAIAMHCPVLIAPAMNSFMYANPVVQSNLEILRNRGFVIIEPEYGRLACGYEGKGRLRNIEAIFEEIKYIFVNKDFEDKNILVTAGPTREKIDPVRFISNRSTGKMGYAVAKAAQYRGARVTLISGPTNLDLPIDISNGKRMNVINVETAIEMQDAVLKNFNQSDIVVMSAAVADYRPQNYSPKKIKKSSSETLSMSLVRNPDILAELGNRKKSQFLVGFAAETDDLITNAKIKLTDKNLDLIVVNDITKPDAGFESDTNIVTIISKYGECKKLPKMSKFDVANTILDIIIQTCQKTS